MGRLFSEWKLRAEAEKRGVSVSHKQFEGYRAWELIPDPSDDERWPPEMVDRLIEIRKLEKRARPLWRRAILLQSRGYPMRPGALRRAMLRTLPTVKAPKRKMRRLDAAIRWESRKLEDPAYVGFVRFRPIGRANDFMEPNRWKAILGRRDIDDSLFSGHVFPACYFAIGLKGATANTPYDISKIRDEEIIALLTIRQLAGLTESMGTDRLDARPARARVRRSRA